MELFKYPKLITELSESADRESAEVEGFTSDLIQFAFLALVQDHFDTEGQMVDRDAVVAGSAEFIQKTVLLVAGLVAAFCGEPTEEDELFLNPTKH